MASQIPVSEWGVDTSIQEPSLGTGSAVHCNSVAEESDASMEAGEGDGAELPAEYLILRQAARSLRESRHRGSCDRVRIQKSIRCRKGKKKRKRLLEDQDSSRPQEPIVPSCTRTNIITPTVTPGADTNSHSSLPTSTRSLLQQLRETDLDHSDDTMTSPPASPQPSNSSIRESARMLARGVTEGCLWREETNDAPNLDFLTEGEDHSLYWLGKELDQ